ncbi:MAG TPA: DUF2071 domain-containing protein [Chloroflexia bacterium]|nr:DUF2071 domain-containing protein [Chloroflexia bacterium]
MLKLPTINGTIKRRVLVNFRADPEVVQRLLPAPCRPKLHEGQAVVGICLIRLEHLRPRLMPEFAGFSSENAAHRIAVEWVDEQGVPREGVFIPRRDTNSPVNLLLGGRLFPGEHHRARFKVREEEEAVAVSMRSSDGEVAVSVKGRLADGMPDSSIFDSVDDASRFFEAGYLGYSMTSARDRLDALELHTDQWHVEPLAVSSVHSSFFADESLFPRGSVRFDHALLMRDIEHEWHTAATLYL